jgi:hypothetical protein
VALFLEQVDPPFAGVKMREFVKGTELFNLRSSESIDLPNFVHGNNLLSHLFGVGASTVRSMSMVGSKSAIGRMVGGGIDGDGREGREGEIGGERYYQIQNR